MNKTSLFLTLFGALFVLVSVPSCRTVSPKTETAQPAKPKHDKSSYDYFVTRRGYPKTMSIYRNEALLRQANGKSPVYICLSQQRGRLYVNGQVAADWPVSTGIAGRETPTGSFTIQEKKKAYASNRYGKMYDAEGKCVDFDADAFKDTVPEGGKFVGASMPNWQRLTSDGIGMHTGKVRAGRRLSHGCIRTPHRMASELFDITRPGSRVTVTQGLEACYPAKEALGIAQPAQPAAPSGSAASGATR